MTRRRAPGSTPASPNQTGDGIDSNCDGKELCFLDADNDGYRKDATSTKPTTSADAQHYDADRDDSGEAFVTDPTTDCADTDATKHPGATDLCDAVDRGCDGV